MKIVCKDCGAVISAADVNLETLVAKCRDCNAVFGFADALHADGTPVAAPRKREKVPMPPRFRVDEGISRLTIVRPWFTPMIVALAVFCVFWDGFLVFWYGIASQSGAPLIMFLFPLIHVAVGAGLTYSVIAGFVNQTTIEVTRGRLTVVHGPLPWPGNVDMLPADLSQVFGREIVNRGKNGVSYSYTLMALLQDGRSVKLVSGLTDANQALFLEQKIEDYLRIADRSVPGELPK